MSNKEKNAWQLAIRTPKKERDAITRIAKALEVNKGYFMEVCAENLLEFIDNGGDLSTCLLPAGYNPGGDSKMMTVNIDPDVQERVKKTIGRLRQRNTTFFLWAAMLEYFRLEELNKQKAAHPPKRKKK